VTAPQSDQPYGFLRRGPASPGQKEGRKRVGTKAKKFWEEAENQGEPKKNERATVCLLWSEKSKGLENKGMYMFRPGTKPAVDFVRRERRKRQQSELPKKQRRGRDAVAEQE